MQEYTFIFDVDGTLCPIKKEDEKYEDLVPYQEIIERIREYKKRGMKIVLYTSRNMNSFQGDIDKILTHTKPVLENWLKKWRIPYDDIVFGKPWPGHKGFYVDDRTVRPDEFINHTIQELEDICSASRKELR